MHLGIKPGILLKVQQCKCILLFTVKLLNLKLLNRLPLQSQREAVRWASIGTCWLALADCRPVCVLLDTVSGPTKRTEPVLTKSRNRRLSGTEPGCVMLQVAAHDLLGPLHGLSAAPITRFWYLGPRFPDQSSEDPATTASAQLEYWEQSARCSMVSFCLLAVPMC